MYLLYLDESENSNKNRKNIFSTNVFGLSGILVTPRYCTTLVQEIYSLKKKHKIPHNWEIHGFEIFSGTGKWKRKFSDYQRREICTDVAKLIGKKSKITKGWFCYKESQLLKKDYLTALQSLLGKSCSFISKYGTKTGKQLLIIFDQKDEFEKSINNFILEQRNSINIDGKKSKCRIIDHGFPGKSELSELLQLSDFMGYVFRLSKTLRRSNTLSLNQHDSRHIDFVDGLVKRMKKKVTEIRL